MDFCITYFLRLCIIFLILTTECLGSNVTANRRLLNELFSVYDRADRPVRNASHPVVQHFGAALKQVVDLDEKQEILITSLWIRQNWIDEFLVWDPSEYEGIDVIHVPYKKIWIPDIVQYHNAADEMKPMYEDVIAQVSYYGGVAFMYPALYHTYCSMQIRHFPFDQQMCELKFGSWVYDGLKLDLELRVPNPADFSNYIRNSEWGLVKFEAIKNEVIYGCCPEPFPDITFYITLRRRSNFYMFYLVYPNLLISLVTCFQFYLPCDSTERITLGTTIFLSLTVYLLLLARLLPAGEVIPLIGEYFAITIGLVTFSLLGTFVILHVHFNGTHDNHLEVPHWARELFLHGTAKFTCLLKEITPDEEHEVKLHEYKSELNPVIDSNTDIFVPTASNFELTNTNKDSLFTNINIEPEESSKDELQGGQNSENKDDASTCPKSKDQSETISSQTTNDKGKIKRNSVASLNTNQNAGTEIRGVNYNKEKRNSLTLPDHKIHLPTPQNRRHSVLLADSRITLHGAPSTDSHFQAADLKKKFYLARILHHLEEYKEVNSQKMKDGEVKLEWQQLAMVLDRLLLYIFVGVLFIVTIATFSQVPIYDEPIIL